MQFQLVNWEGVIGQNGSVLERHCEINTAKWSPADYRSIDNKRAGEEVQNFSHQL